MIDVRKIDENELGMLVCLYEYKSFDSMIDAIKNGSLEIFCVFEDGKLAGELHVKHISDDLRFAEKGKRAYLFAFRVLNEHRGNGIGQHLLKSTLTSLTEAGYREFTVGVEDDNERARHIYEKFGFTRSIARIEETFNGDYYEYNLLLKA